VRVRRRSSASELPAPRTRPASQPPQHDAAARARADDVLAREVGGRASLQLHLPWQHHEQGTGAASRTRPRGSVVESLARRHRAAVERREEQRRVRRLRRFDGLGAIAEGATPNESAAAAAAAPSVTPAPLAPPTSPPRRRTSVSTRASSEPRGPDEHSWEAVEVLDVVDARVSTVGMLGSMARAIVLPASMAGGEPLIDLPTPEERVAARLDDELELGEPLKRTASDHLDAHVRAQLDKRQRRKAWVKKTAAGIWTFMKTPLGIVVSIYGFLVVCVLLRAARFSELTELASCSFTGAALVICLFGWVPGNKDLQVEAFSQAINALFTITGVGLIPWRVRDTYRISRICHYRNTTARLRRERGLPPLRDFNDFSAEREKQAAAAVRERKRASEGSAPSHGAESDEEDAEIQLPEIEMDAEHVLRPDQAHRLTVLQDKFAESATWYRYVETSTHRA
jgi:hypothetical protein